MARQSDSRFDPPAAPDFALMETCGRVVVRQVFPPGTPVRLVGVAGGAIHAAGGRRVASGTVDATGTVDFPADLGAFYFVVGRVDGRQVEVRVRARDDWDDVPERVSQRRSALGADPADPDASRQPSAPPEPAPDGVWRMFSGGPPVRPQPLRQEDVPGHVRQRALGDTGIATPVPGESWGSS
jgi:hypothetical protein